MYVYIQRNIALINTYRKKLIGIIYYFIGLNLLKKTGSVRKKKRNGTHLFIDLLIYSFSVPTLKDKVLIS